MLMVRSVIMTLLMTKMTMTWFPPLHCRRGSWAKWTGRSSCTWQVVIIPIFCIYALIRKCDELGCINIQLEIFCNDGWAIFTFWGISSTLVCRQIQLFELSHSQGDPSKPPEHHSMSTSLDQSSSSSCSINCTWCSTSFWSKRTGDFASFGLMQRM